MKATINKALPLSKRPEQIVISFDTQKEKDIFKTLIGYYPYQTMEKLRVEFGNKFPDVTTDEVRTMVDTISKSLNLV